METGSGLVGWPRLESEEPKCNEIETWDDAEQRPSCIVAGATEQFDDRDKKEKQEYAQHQKKSSIVEKGPNVPLRSSFLHMAAPRNRI